MLKPIEIDPKTFLREHCSLPALPEVVVRIQGMMQDEGTDSAMIAQIISGDPALVAQVLAVVNSAYYSLPNTTSNVKYAVAYLGLSVIQRIVISVGVVNAMGIKEKKELPNLIVIDGGRAQLNAAWSVLRDLGLNLPVIGLAKKEEEIYLVESMEALKLSKKEKALQLLIQVRDEAHRFAVKYHRLLRKKGMDSCLIH